MQQNLDQLKLWVWLLNILSTFSTKAFWHYRMKRFQIVSSSWDLTMLLRNFFLSDTDSQTQTERQTERQTKQHRDTRTHTERYADRQPDRDRGMEWNSRIRTTSRWNSDNDDDDNASPHSTIMTSQPRRPPDHQQASHHLHLLHQHTSIHQQHQGHLQNQQQGQLSLPSLRGR